MNDRDTDENEASETRQSEDNDAPRRDGMTTQEGKLWYMVLHKTYLDNAVEHGEATPHKFSEITTSHHTIISLDMPDHFWKDKEMPFNEDNCWFRILFRSKAPAKLRLEESLIPGSKWVCGDEISFRQYVRYYTASISVDDWLSIDVWADGKWMRTNRLIEDYQRRLSPAEGVSERQRIDHHNQHIRQVAEQTHLRQEVASLSLRHAKELGESRKCCSLVEQYNVHLMRCVESLSENALLSANVLLKGQLENVQLDHAITLEAEAQAHRDIEDFKRHAEYCHRLLRRSGIPFNPTIGHQTDEQAAA